MASQEERRKNSRSLSQNYSSSSSSAQQLPSSKERHHRQPLSPPLYGRRRGRGRIVDITPCIVAKKRMIFLFRCILLINPFATDRTLSWAYYRHKCACSTDATCLLLDRLTVYETELQFMMKIYSLTHFH